MAIGCSSPFSSILLKIKNDQLVVFYYYLKVTICIDMCTYYTDIEGTQTLYVVLNINVKSDV